MIGSRQIFSKNETRGSPYSAAWFPWLSPGQGMRYFLWGQEVPGSNHRYRRRRSEPLACSGHRSPLEWGRSGLFDGLWMGGTGVEYSWPRRVPGRLSDSEIVIIYDFGEWRRNVEWDSRVAKRMKRALKWSYSSQGRYPDNHDQHMVSVIAAVHVCVEEFKIGTHASSDLLDIFDFFRLQTRRGRKETFDWHHRTLIQRLFLFRVFDK